MGKEETKQIKTQIPLEGTACRGIKQCFRFKNAVALRCKRGLAQKTGLAISLLGGFITK